MLSCSTVKQLCSFANQTSSLLSAAQSTHSQVRGKLSGFCTEGVGCWELQCEFTAWQACAVPEADPAVR